MRIRLALPLASILIIISSCGNSSRENVFFQNFDNVQAWSIDHSRLTNKIAYSGQYSTKMDSANEYSQTFQIDFSYILLHKYHTVKVTSKAYCSGGPDGLSMIVAIDSPEKNVLWKSESFGDHLKGARVWGDINFETQLPSDAPVGSILKVYGWANKKNEGFLDDVNITFE